MPKKLKNITVKDLLSMMDEDQKVGIFVYAYGFLWGETLKDGMETAKECLDKCGVDILKAKVFHIGCVEWYMDGERDYSKQDYVAISCEVIDGMLVGDSEKDMVL